MSFELKVKAVGMFTEHNWETNKNWESITRPEGCCLLVFDFPAERSRGVSRTDSASTFLAYWCARMAEECGWPFPSAICLTLINQLIQANLLINHVVNGEETHREALHSCKRIRRELGVEWKSHHFLVWDSFQLDLLPGITPVPELIRSIRRLCFQVFHDTGDQYHENGHTLFIWNHRRIYIDISII